MSTRPIVKTISVVVFLALGSLGSSQARAQQTSAPRDSAPTATPYRLVGTVVAPSGNPVAGADVSIVQGDSAARRVSSDSAGTFQFDNLTVRSLTLRVRRLGFEPQVLDVHVAKTGRVAKVTVTLDPAVARLETVIVDDTVTKVPPNPRLVGFNERLKTNSFAHFVTPEMLAKMRPQHASEALRELPGVITRPATGRIGNIVRLRGCGTHGVSSEKVGPLVWLDGVRLVGAEIDEVTQGMDIAAIEVYNSFAGVPAQYFDRTAVCGTILVWTKHR
ncbi:MAG TPA: carboxypeptidase regulatory-like domain-containing protein [Gemmatimonadaceae bacterium]